MPACPRRLYIDNPVSYDLDLFALDPGFLNGPRPSTTKRCSLAGRSPVEKKKSRPETSPRPPTARPPTTPPLAGRRGVIREVVNNASAPSTGNAGARASPSTDEDGLPDVSGRGRGRRSLGDLKGDSGVSPFFPRLFTFLAVVRGGRRRPIGGRCDFLGPSFWPNSGGEAGRAKLTAGEGAGLLPPS